MSLVIRMSDGLAVEVATIGNEGLLDREGLEEGACGCYRLVREEYERLLGS